MHDKETFIHEKFAFINKSFAGCSYLRARGEIEIRFRLLIMKKGKREGVRERGGDIQPTTQREFVDGGSRVGKVNEVSRHTATQRSHVENISHARLPIASS